MQDYKKHKQQSKKKTTTSDNQSEVVIRSYKLLIILVLLIAILVGLFVAACNLSNGYCAEYVTTLLADTAAPVTENKAKVENINANIKKEEKQKTFLENLHITKNEPDYSIKKSIFSAHKLSLNDNTVLESVRLFESLLLSYPNSPRIRYGLAYAYDKLSSIQRSNQHLEKAIDLYYKLAISHTPNDTPTELLIDTLDRLADRAAFRGFRSQSIEAFNKLIQVEADQPKWRNKLGIQYLMYGNENEAGLVFEQILQIWPDNGLAQCHLGFVECRRGNFEAAIKHIKLGLEQEQDCHDGKFFNKLGESLIRLDRKEEAFSYFEQGAKEGKLYSAWQRSLYNEPNLKAQPWWSPEETGHTDYIAKLESSWKIIRKEARSILNEETGLFEKEAEGLTDTGDWKQYNLYMQGRKFDKNCERTPKTCQLLEQMPDVAGCKRGQVKFSVMHPGTHVWPHCGPTNCRLRMHLGLIIPDNVRIRCGNATKTWEEGKIIIFDDSFEHEVWQEAKSLRIILIVDIWHPELTLQQKRMLSPI